MIKLYRNEKIVSGEQIPAYVEELQQLMSDWQKFQVDSCYIGEDGKHWQGFAE